MSSFKRKVASFKPLPPLLPERAGRMDVFAGSLATIMAFAALSLTVALANISLAPPLATTDSSMQARGMQVHQIDREQTRLEKSARNGGLG